MSISMSSFKTKAEIESISDEMSHADVELSSECHCITRFNSTGLIVPMASFKVNWKLQFSFPFKEIGLLNSLYYVLVWHIGKNGLTKQWMRWTWLKMRLLCSGFLGSLLSFAIIPPLSTIQSYLLKNTDKKNTPIRWPIKNSTQTTPSKRDVQSRLLLTRNDQ